MRARRREQRRERGGAATGSGRWVEPLAERQREEGREREAGGERGADGRVAGEPCEQRAQAGSTDRFRRDERACDEQPVAAASERVGEGCDGRMREEHDTDAPASDASERAEGGVGDRGRRRLHRERRDEGLVEHGFTLDRIGRELTTVGSTAKTAAVLSELLALVSARAGVDGAAWLDGACAGLSAGQGALAELFPAASRRVGRGPLGAASPREYWRVDDGARVALLLAASGREPTVTLAAARDLYFSGDAREKVGVLRALPWLDSDVAGDPAALATVLDAVRVNQGEIFEAALLDDGYGARHLPPHEFRKAVLKAVFLGLPLARIAGLAARADAELSASLLDYVHEREAAGRSVPVDLWAVAALHPPPGLVAKLVGLLEHPDSRHRAAAAHALRLAGDARARPFVADRAAREPDAAVAAALRT